MLTIQEAAETTGWSPRMLRYLEQAGLLEPSRSSAGYRLYGPAELQRLRTLRELLTRHEIGLTDVGFARRLRTEPALADALDHWFDAPPARPDDVPAADWLRWEQEKHERLLSLAEADTGADTHTSADTHISADAHLSAEADHNPVKETA
jgi:MerR family copper efflux transcriptional regulator